MEKLNSTHPYNSTDLGAVKLIKTTQNLVTYSISKKAVRFLKGLLVTRVMPSFYILLFLISLPLNALALVTFTCKINENKPSVIYMSNLACVDLLFTLLLPLKIHYQLNGSDWVFSEVACRVVTAGFYCYMYCSILLMMCMSVDRLGVILCCITMGRLSADSRSDLCFGGRKPKELQSYQTLLSCAYKENRVNV